MSFAKRLYDDDECKPGRAEKAVDVLSGVSETFSHQPHSPLIEAFQ
jgi:hypothetical protein